MEQEWSGLESRPTTPLDTGVWHVLCAASPFQQSTLKGVRFSARVVECVLTLGQEEVCRWGDVNDLGPLDLPLYAMEAHALILHYRHHTAVAVEGLFRGHPHGAERPELSFTREIAPGQMFTFKGGMGGREK